MTKGTKRLRRHKSLCLTTNQPGRIFSCSAVNRSLATAFLPPSARFSGVLRLNPTKSGSKFKKYPRAHLYLPFRAPRSTKNHQAAPSSSPLSHSQSPQIHADPTYSTGGIHLPIGIGRPWALAVSSPSQAPWNQHPSCSIVPDRRGYGNATGIELLHQRKRRTMPSMSPLRHCETN
jgi:hypothetical protein